MTINIVNKHAHIPTKQDVYCGRGTALGNPFVMTDAQDRDQVCNKYATWLPALIAGNTSNEKIQAMKQLVHIRTLAKQGDVNLVCFCAPKRCHCETIKEVVERTMVLADV